jgi:hypothetical protein
MELVLPNSPPPSRMLVPFASAISNGSNEGGSDSRYGKASAAAPWGRGGAPGGRGGLTGGPGPNVCGSKGSLGAAVDGPRRSKRASSGAECAFCTGTVAGSGRDGAGADGGAEPGGGGAGRDGARWPLAPGGVGRGLEGGTAGRGREGGGALRVGDGA